MISMTRDVSLVMVVRLPNLLYHRRPASRSGEIGALLSLLPLVDVQDALAHSDALRRHLDQLVRADVFDGAVQAHLRGRSHPLLDLRGRLAEVRQRLLIAYVYLQIRIPDVLADDHALVDLHARPNELDAPILHVHQAIAGSQAALGG